MRKICPNCDQEFEGKTKFCPDCKPLIKQCMNTAFGYNRKYYATHGWYQTYLQLRNRCNDPAHKTYQYYGGRGIQNFLKTNDLKFLWFRDGADKMETPSLHRKDNDGHYTIENCQYMEWKEHHQFHKGRQNETE